MQFQPISNRKERQIIKALEDRGVDQPCPRCGKDDFAVLGGYVVHVLQTKPAEINLAGPAVPSVGIVCANCGFISHHALGVLRISAEEEAENE